MSAVIIASRNAKARTLAPEQAGVESRFVCDFELVFDEYHLARHYKRSLDAVIFDLDLAAKAVTATEAARYLKRHDSSIVIVYVASRELSLRRRLDLADTADAVIEGSDWPAHLIASGSLEALCVGKAQLDCIRRGEREAMSA